MNAVELHTIQDAIHDIADVECILKEGGHGGRRANECLIIREMPAWPGIRLR